MSKTGKHGHAKVHLTGVDIFTGKKYESVESSSHNVEVPIVTKKEYDLIDIKHNGDVVYRDDNGEFNESLKMDTTKETF